MSPRKRKTYLAVVGLGGLALAVDRLIPAAQVTQPGSSFAAQSAIAAPMPLVSPLSIPHLPFPRTIQSRRSQTDIRDLFAPPFLPDGQSPGSQGIGTGSEKRQANLAYRENGTQEFDANHNLNAVMVNGTLRVAVLEGVWVREGQTIDGCKLERISGNQATFSCHNGDVTLTSGIDDLPPFER